MTNSGHETCTHKSYGLTCVDYDALLLRAGGRCERCQTSAARTPRGKLVIDHDHRWGRSSVRGLLCMKCNTHLRHVDAGARQSDEQTLAYLSLSNYPGPTVEPRPVVRRTDVPQHRVPRTRGKRRPMFAFKLDDSERAALEREALDQGLTIRNGEPNASEMARLMLAYASTHMPKGWRPPTRPS